MEKTNQQKKIEKIEAMIRTTENLIEFFESQPQTEEMNSLSEKLRQESHIYRTWLHDAKFSPTTY